MRENPTDGSQGISNPAFDFADSMRSEEKEIHAMIEKNNNKEEAPCYLLIIKE